MLVVLALAEVAGRLLVAKTREDWELMKEPLAWPAREGRPAAAGLCNRQVPLLDTS